MLSALPDRHRQTMERYEYDTMRRLEDTHWWYSAIRQIVSRTLQLKGGKRPLKILDVGCGTGGGMISIANRLPDSLLVGVDLDEMAIRYSSQREIGSVAQASAHTLPFRDSSFDAVTMIDLLCTEGLEDGLAILEGRRVLYDGGILVVNVPAFDWLRGEHDRAVRIRHRYLRKEVRRLVEKNGFQVKILFYWNSLLFPVVTLVRNILRPERGKLTPISDVRRLPKWLNQLLAGLLSIDVALAARISFPFGVSVYCVAEKLPRNLTPA